jgi:hypothetical protein
LPNGLFGADSYPWRTNLVRSLGLARQKIHALRADSQRAETLARAKKLLSGKALDLLFINGDHRYEGVKTDFATYAALVRKGVSSPCMILCRGKRNMLVACQIFGVK